MAASECESTFCVDGVCCHTACTDGCHACSAVLTGGTDGVCGAVENGSADPRGSCAEASCSAGMQTTASTCDGAGNCQAGTTSACGAYACAGSACAPSCTSNAQCAPNAACSGSTCFGSIIASGQRHTCVVVNGGVQCWGWNNAGQLGNNSFADKKSPVQVQGLSNNSGVTAVAAKATRTCAIVNGGAKCWGANSNGELGNGTQNQSSVPVQVLGLTSGVQAIAAGGAFNCALVNGGVQCWGANDKGQLGNPTASNPSLSPVPVMGLPSGVQAITAGGAHACALVNGGVWCWGLDSDHGELGDGTNVNSAVPVQVVNLASGVHAISSAYYFTCAVLDNGGIRCWGQGGSSKNLGNGSTADSPTPIQVPGITTGYGISLGEYHACAIVGGGAQCWGSNATGQIGDGSGTDPNGPTQVLTLTSGVQALGAGGLHTCAWVNGGVWCWGSNGNGELGNGTMTNSPTPVAVTLL